MITIKRASPYIRTVEQSGVHVLSCNIRISIRITTRDLIFI